MLANCVLVIASACVAALAHARADDPKPMKPPVPPSASDKTLPAASKYPTVIPLEVLDVGEAVALLVKGCGQSTVLEPLFDEKAILVYADEKKTNEIKKVLRSLGEPVRAPKRPHVIPVSDVLDVDETVKLVKKMFPAKTVIVPLRDEHALLAYVTDADANDIRQIIRPFIEKK